MRLLEYACYCYLPNTYFYLQIKTEKAANSDIVIVWEYTKEKCSDGDWNTKNYTQWREASEASLIHNVMTVQHLGILLCQLIFKCNEI